MFAADSEVQVGPGGPAFLLGANFFAVRSYNPSMNYALALVHLGDKCVGGGPFLQKFPGSERAPTLAEVQEIQRRLTRCFPRGGEETLGHLGTTQVTASVATGIEMGPARPPYMAPENAAALIKSRLPKLMEIL